MNIYFFVASLLGFALGLVHSVLGEVRIFRRRGGGVPSLADVPLKASHVRILRATWHVVTVFGWGYAAFLLRMSRSPLSLQPFVEGAVALVFLLTSMLTLVSTRGRHPGWIVLLVIATLVWLGSDF